MTATEPRWIDLLREQHGHRMVTHPVYEVPSRYVHDVLREAEAAQGAAPLTCKRCGHHEGCSARCCMNQAEPCDLRAAPRAEAYAGRPSDEWFRGRRTAPQADQRIPPKGTTARGGAELAVHFRRLGREILRLLEREP